MNKNIPTWLVHILFGIFFQLPSLMFYYYSDETFIKDSRVPLLIFAVISLGMIILGFYTFLKSKKNASPVTASESFEANFSKQYDGLFTMPSVAASKNNVVLGLGSFYSKWYRLGADSKIISKILITQDGFKAEGSARQLGIMGILVASSIGALFYCCNRPVWIPVLFSIAMDIFCFYCLFRQDEIVVSRGEVLVTTKSLFGTKTEFKKKSDISHFQVSKFESRGYEILLCFSNGQKRFIYFSYSSQECEFLAKKLSEHLK